MLRRWSIVGVIVGLFVGLFQVVAAPSAFASTGTTTTAVNVRSGPGESNALLGTVAANSTVSFHCFVAGERETGKYGTEDIWDALGSGGYVADALVFTGSNSAVVPACPSAQFGTGHYPVAWTGGGGAQPYSGTSTGTSPDGAVLPDGLVVTVTCETTGQTLTDSASFTSDLWDQLSSGAYIPNVYIDTQVNGPTPGLPACSQPSSGGSPSSGSGSGSGGGAPPASSSGKAPQQTANPTKSASSSSPSKAAGTGDVCLAAYGPGQQSSHSIFGGGETDYDRAASLYQACEGFGAPIGYSVPMKCAIIVAAATLGGPPFNALGHDVCDRVDAADAIVNQNWIGGVASLSCEWGVDVLAEGLAIAAAGATSETGPGAALVGAVTYRALASSLTLVCGGLLDGGAATTGYNLEAHHEAAIASDILTKGKCLRYRKVFGLIFWSAATC